MKQSLTNYTTNRTRAVAIQGLRRSGASGSHASGTRRERGRRAGKSAAIRFSASAG
ncbi:hypothetical protein [Streptomyces sp. NBC_01304]|uniref:hypothetical protein n=1 Tax=Streptomyces sp. NBC_01304 TaxID=2903818 RepID=UPI002E0D9ADB|nr:hypothetical protein OG430_47735 [Streptomyces sp. NBC_01304]